MEWVNMQYLIKMRIRFKVSTIVTGEPSIKAKLALRSSEAAVGVKRTYSHSKVKGDSQVEFQLIIENILAG